MRNRNVEQKRGTEMGNRNQFKREKKRERLEKGKFQKRCVFFCLPEILGKDKKKKKKKY